MIAAVEARTAAVSACALGVLVGEKRKPPRDRSSGFLALIHEGVEHGDAQQLQPTRPEPGVRRAHGALHVAQQRFDLFLRFGGIASEPAGLFRRAGAGLGDVPRFPPHGSPGM
jgi:hypothetical protein